MQRDALSIQGCKATGPFIIFQAVMAVDEERQRLEREAESLLGNESEEAQTRLEDLYERWEGSHKHGG